MKQVRIRITGHVQGVFFRATAQEEAEKLRLFGVAKNETDGSVTIDVGGNDDRINEFIGWCLHGPEGATVDHIDVQETQFPETGEFVIER